MGAVIGTIIILVILALPFGLIALLVWMMRRRIKREAQLAAIPRFSSLILPFWATIGKAFAVAWENLGEFFRIAWGWLLLIVPVIALLNSFAFPTMDIHHPVQPSGWDLFLSVLSSVTMIVLGASIAVAWHRLILLQEKVTAQPYFRFDGVVLSYVKLALIIYVIKTVPGFISSLLGPAQDLSAHDFNGWKLLWGLVLWVIAIVSIYYAARISVLLPARALGYQTTIKEALDRTSYSVWRLFWAPILIFLPPVIAGGMMLFFGGLGFFGRGLLLMLMFLVSMPAYLSFLSLSYQYLFGSEGGGKSQSA